MWLEENVEKYVENNSILPSKLHTFEWGLLFVDFCDFTLVGMSSDKSKYVKKCSCWSKIYLTHGKNVKTSMHG